MPMVIILSSVYAIFKDSTNLLSLNMVIQIVQKLINWLITISMAQSCQIMKKF